MSRHTLRDIAEQFQRWLKGWSEKRNIPVAEAPKGRRDDFVEAYFRGANPDQVVVIVKAREPARIMTAIGDSKTNHWHLQIANRWVVQYNFYINDRQWGRTEIEDMDLPNPVIRNYGNGLATTRCQPTPRPLNALRIPSAMPIFALS